MNKIILVAIYIGLSGSTLILGLENWDAILEDEPVDTSHWINPHDMGLEKPEVPSQTQKPSDTPPKDDPKPVTVQLKSTRPVKEIKEASKCLSTTSIDDLFAFRFVQHILKQLKIAEQDSSENLNTFHQFDVKVELTQIQVQTLRRFVKESGNKLKSDKERAGMLQDVDSIMSSFIRSSVRTPEVEWTEVIQDYASNIKFYLPNGQDLFWIILLAAVMIFFYLLRVGIPVWKWMLMVFVSSSIWHWGYMYKKALVSKHMALMKSSSIPSECLNEKSWSDFFFSSNKKCSEYHEALLIDPLWEVTPTMAMAETLTMLIVQPLEHVGKHIGKFFSALLGEQSWISALPVFIFVCILILFLSMMILRYKIKLPFMMGSFEPQDSAASESVVRVQVLEQENQRLSEYVRHLEEDKRQMFLQLSQSITHEKHETKKADDEVVTRRQLQSSPENSESAKIDLLGAKIEQIHTVLSQLSTDHSTTNKIIVKDDQRLTSVVETVKAVEKLKEEICSAKSNQDTDEMSENISSIVESNKMLKSSTSTSDFDQSGFGLAAGGIEEIATQVEMKCEKIDEPEPIKDDDKPEPMKCDDKPEPKKDDDKPEPKKDDVDNSNENDLNDQPHEEFEWVQTESFKENN